MTCLTSEVCAMGPGPGEKRVPWSPLNMRQVTLTAEAASVFEGGSRAL